MTSSSEESSTETLKTYDVVESAPIPSQDHVSQVAVVGRSGDEIHLALTERAAEVLAHALFHYETAVAAGILAPVDNYDPALWSHVGIDLLRQRAMLGYFALTNDVVNVGRRSGSVTP